MGRTHDKLMLGVARRGNLGRMERLLAEGVDVNAPREIGVHTPRQRVIQWASGCRPPTS